jgi:hypothetical protein
VHELQVANLFSRSAILHVRIRHAHLVAAIIRLTIPGGLLVIKSRYKKGKLGVRRFATSTMISAALLLQAIFERCVPNIFDNNGEVGNDASLIDTSIRTSLARFGQEFVGIVVAHDYDFDLWQVPAQATRSFEPIHAWHTDVEKNDVGVELAGFLQGIDTVRRFCANLAIRLARHNSRYPAPNQLVIIRNQNSQRTAPSMNLLFCIWHYH